MPSASSWSGSPSIKGSSEAMRMALLTFSLIGLQFTWGIEMTYCTPYLLSLGLTKSKTSLVWIAGPLSGLVMQPVVGAIADKSTSKYGRRRPFMIVGSLVVGTFLVLLGWTAEAVGLFVSDEETRKSVTIVVAVLSIYAVDFAVNAVQACCRSLIVDTLPIAQQQSGSAWAARMTASGHVIGYLIGTFDLVQILPNWMGGDTQFKKMALISAFALPLAVGITSWAVTERVLLPSGPAGEPKESPFSVLPALWHRTLNLPPRIQAICWVQFWSWIGWFPFLFYSTTWVGETYYRYERPASRAGFADNHDALGQIGRLGSLSLVIFSFITFGSSIVLPLLVKKASMGSTRDQKKAKFTPRPPPSFPKQLQSFILNFDAAQVQPTLLTTWLASNLFFASVMIFAPLVRSVAFATTLVALAGISWAVSSWAPFAEMGVEINRLSANDSTTPNGSAIRTSGGYTAVPLTVAEDDDAIEMEETQHRRRTFSDGVLRLHHDPDDAAITSSTGELAGVYLGVLNVYTTLPQFVGTAISWAVFSLLEPDKNKVADDDPEHHKWLDLKKDAPNAISICLFVGAICAIGAAEACRRLKKIS